MMKTLGRRHRLLLLLMGLLMAAGCRTQVTMPAWPASYQFTIPFELVSNHIMLPVTVNNSGPLWFIFDTGDKYAIVDSARARALGLKLGSDVEVHGGGEKTITGNFVKGDRYGVVGLTNFTGPVYLAIPLNNISESMGRSVDGILGSDFIRKFVVEIDYANQKFTFYDLDNFTYRGSGVRLPITFDSQDHPVMTAQLVVDGSERAAGKFVVDLGANSPLVLNTPFVNEQHLLDGLKASVPGTTRGTGGLVSGRTARIDALRLGNWTLQQPYVQFSQDSKGAHSTADVQGYIGAEVMRRFRVFLDYQGKSIILEPTARLNDPFLFDTSGLIVQTFGPGYRQKKIISVAEQSPGSEAGLKEGDELLTLDGRPASEIKLSEIQQLFRREDEHQLEIQRGETRLHVTLKLRKRI